MREEKRSRNIYSPIGLVTSESYRGNPVVMLTLERLVSKGAPGGLKVDPAPNRHVILLLARVWS